MSILFSPIKIGTLELKNRIVMPPMGTAYEAPGGEVSQRLIEYYARRAEGGAAMIVVEIAAIDDYGVSFSDELRICDDRYIPGLSRLSQAIKEKGARAAIQLHHPGRQSVPKITGNQPVAPSAIPCPTVKVMPRELTNQEVKELVEKYAQGARRAKEAGFDAVEFHGAHGYLICQFFSPFANERKDEYGGSVENRVRFGLEILKRARELVGKDYPILFRISANEYVEGGLTLEQTTQISKLLEAAGVDAIDVSAGNYHAPQWLTQPVLQRKGCLVPLATEIKRSVKIPVLAVGRINNAKLAETILKEGNADLINMGRPLLADPDLPIKSQQGKRGEVIQCIACNTCMLMIFKAKPIECLMNPEAGKEWQPEKPALAPKKVLIIGNSPACLEAARVAAKKKHDVILWNEKEKWEGHWSWLIRAVIAERKKDLKKLGVKTELGKRISLDEISKVSPDVIMAAQELVAKELSFEGAEEAKIITAQEALDGNFDFRNKVVILGGNNIGCQVASCLKDRIKELDITILEEKARAGTGIEPFTRRMVVSRLLEKRGVKIITGAKAVKFHQDKLYYKSSSGRTEELEAQYLISALGYETKETLKEDLARKGYVVYSLPACKSPDEANDTMDAAAEIVRLL
ncbi:MAG: FAD-dependent oxidoreductase [Candidatus Tectomicrobia bacterium]|uniref:FAD-dependent oxidoreductase n=1 Tax=Tectimicrobiota bacterium TaxID=2528274 RepID=A0A933GKH0_UNCTE|nr:FAD-dependent oxidoreductase [Candidatus Tectomicrobia bacterium]